MSFKVVKGMSQSNKSLIEDLEILKNDIESGSVRSFVGIGEYVGGHPYTFFNITENTDIFRMIGGLQFMINRLLEEADIVNAER